MISWWPHKILNFRGYNHRNAVNGPNMRGGGGRERRRNYLPPLLKFVFSGKKQFFINKEFSALINNDFIISHCKVHFFSKTKVL